MIDPIGAIFGAGVALRNALYDRQILKSHKLARPVISIGNISVGGSGKTPFVIALGTLLKEHGIAFDVLSRGYGRSSTEVAIVDPLGTPEQFGDEPLLIARKLGVPVVVGANRYQAGLLAEEKLPSKLHLLDDGFQHRRLHRDFDIVMLADSDFPAPCCLLEDCGSRDGRWAVPMPWCLHPINVLRNRRNWFGGLGGRFILSTRGQKPWPSVASPVRASFLPA